MNRSLEFGVDSADLTGHITGRNCNHDLDIPVGTTFTSIHKTRVDGDLMHLNSIELGIVGRIQLTLSAVEFYGNNIDVVPGGHSAGLTLEGDGLEMLVDVLQNLSKREFVSIAAERT